MLQKISRLQKSKDIERVLKEGKGLKEDSLVLKTAKNDLNQPRFAFLVSKKVSKKASQRNKLKRTLSETVKRQLAEIKEGRDYLLISLPGLERKDPQEIEQVFRKLLKKTSR